MFIGATGWYDWKAYEDRGIPETIARQVWSRKMDANYVNFGNHKSPAGLGQLQTDDLVELVQEYSDNPDVHEIVVVTHMSPKAELMEWKDGNSYWNEGTPSYVNTYLERVLEADSNKKITHWVYGHTHRRDIREIDGVKFVNNARGFPKENPPFSLTQIETGIMNQE